MQEALAQLFCNTSSSLLLYRVKRKGKSCFVALSNQNECQDQIKLFVDKSKRLHLACYHLHTWQNWTQKTTVHITKASPPELSPPTSKHTCSRVGKRLFSTTLLLLDVKSDPRRDRGYHSPAAVCITEYPKKPKKHTALPSLQGVQSSPSDLSHVLPHKVWGGKPHGNRELSE